MFHPLETGRLQNTQLSFQWEQSPSSHVGQPSLKQPEKAEYTVSECFLN